MKKVLTIFGILFTLFSQANSTVKKPIGDTVYSIISNLNIGDTVTFKTYQANCLSGEQYQTLDSVYFYRDSLNLISICGNKKNIVEPEDLEKIKEIEVKMLTIGFTTKTSYYNYIIQFKNDLGLIGTGEINTWDELKNLILDLEHTK